MDQVVAVIGGGGREHALVWKLAQSPLVEKILVAPGNAGCSKIKKAVTYPSLNIKDNERIVRWCQDELVDLVVVGPEDPLANGLADRLSISGISCFGPSRLAARIESSKLFAKQFMNSYGIPTARWAYFNNAYDAKDHINSASYRAFVVKASGLAAGKGVIVTSSREEACEAVDKIMSDFELTEEPIIVEELLEGEELSVLAFCDGSSALLMPPSQDHKRLCEDDLGPNTGGMGAYCPCPHVDDENLNFIRINIVEKTVAELKRKGCSFIGVLYVGIMLTSEGPKVLEYNCRFGDPEAEVTLPLLKSDLYEILNACVNGTLEPSLLSWQDNSRYAVGIVLASKGYPQSSEKGQAITGTDVASDDTLIFHAATAEQDGCLVTAGGRVLIVVVLHSRLDVAAAIALRQAKAIAFPNAQYRTDIAFRAIEKLALSQNISKAYTEAGVNVEEGNKLVKMISPLAGSTRRPGVLSMLGGFGGFFDLKSLNIEDPILVSGTDGVGTKLHIAHLMKSHKTIGIDLVAMCVNDILAHGAESLFFLDYYACNRLDVKVAQEVIEGICIGCQQSGCTLLGGETAEMPKTYCSSDGYELAGFAVGVVERIRLLPNESEMKNGDIVLGIQSSGLHSNGFSLVRKIVEQSSFHYDSPAPFNKEALLGDELLKPTTIYASTLLPLLKKNMIKGIAHITGGGLIDNVPRILPPSLRVILDASKWPIQAIFSWLQMQGNISEEDMLRTFNCGIGMVLIVAAENVDNVLSNLNSTSKIASQIGSLIHMNAGDQKIHVENWTRSLWQCLPLSIPNIADFPKSRKKVAVLISGSGTNLQALIDFSHFTGNNSNFEISLVISNMSNALGLKRAELFNIPTKVVSHKNFQSRVQFDSAIDKTLQEENIDLICLAGFMRILTGEFVRQWHGRMLNIHPSLLPSFKGANAHKQVLDAGVRITGCTVHFVVEEVDAGGIIMQKAVPVQLDDTEESLQERVKKAEHETFPKALQWVAADEVMLTDENKVVWKSKSIKN